MATPRARHVLAGFLVLGAFVTACSDVPRPMAPPQSQARAESQSAAYQQQAGYAKAGEYPQQAPGTLPAPTSTAYPVPGLVEAAPTTVPDALGQLDRAE